MSFVDVVAAREALYDHDLGVVGYELMFRQVEQTTPHPTDELAGRRAASSRSRDEQPTAQGPELITASVLFSAMSVGIDKLVGDQLAFCSADRALLTGLAPLTLPPKQTVIQIRPDVTIDDSVLDGCRRLAMDGYRFAISDFARRDAASELMELVTFAKFDFTPTPDTADLAPLMSRCWDYGMKLVASRVETPEQLSVCRDLGFDYFQGHALSRPRVVTGRTTQTTAAGRMRVAASLIGTEVEIDELESIVRTEPGLIYQLMQLASVGNRDGMRREVRTLRDALVLVGARRLQSWIALLMLTQPGVTVKEDMVVALTRARMTELLIGKVSPWLAGLAFTAGMVSAFDLMLGMPAEEVMKLLPLADDLREAAFGDTSAVGKLVRDVVDHQNGEVLPEWRSGLDELDFDIASLKALTWAVDATRELKVA